MPPDERATRSAERCDIHPGRVSIATCDGCGRPLCLTCAVPVRGTVLGAECLSHALGPDVLPEELAAGARGRMPGSLLTGAAFILAVASTGLPWSRFGQGSGAFGAWGLSPRWSVVASAAAVLGLALWLTLESGILRPRPTLDSALGVLSALVLCSALLAVLRPPPFTHASLAPWLAVVGGLGGGIGSVRSRRLARAAPERS